jgi:CheY-like chemotaxis protein
MSHELRTPLNGVLGYTQLLQRDRTMTAAQLESLDAISQCGVHLLELINDVLDLSKIEAGKVEVELAPCNVHQAVVDLQHVILEPARRKGLGLVVEVEPDVPPRVVLDGRYLRQVLLNLLGNAVKFTAQGRVSLRIARQGDRLRFEVTDTGIGIEPESLDAIFEAFRQTRSGAAAGGTGLGLAISQRLVRAMGGEIEVESYVGRGSRFAFDLPLIVAEGDTAAEEATEDEWLDARLAPGESLTVLVVDDSSVNRRILVSLLESAGVRAITAAGGLEAVELTRRHRPDVVLMDLRMDDLDGFEATRRIHADRETASVPVIAVTASAFRNARESARAAGCVDFVAKPVRAAVLFEKLERHAGVRFERAAAAAPPVPATAITLLAGEPARALAERLRQALAIGSVTDLDALARELASRDPGHAELGRRIERMASQFDFDALEALAGELETRGKGAHVAD